MSVAPFTKTLSALKTNAAFKCLREYSTSPAKSVQIYLILHMVCKSPSAALPHSFPQPAPEFTHWPGKPPFATVPRVPGSGHCTTTNSEEQQCMLESSKGEGWQGKRQPEAKQLLHTRGRERSSSVVRERKHNRYRAKETLGKGLVLLTSKFLPPLNVEALEIFGSTPGKETALQLPAVTSKLPMESAPKAARDWELALQGHPFKAVGISRGANAPHPIELKTLRSYLILLKNLPPLGTVRQLKLLSTLGD